MAMTAMQLIDRRKVLADSINELVGEYYDRSKETWFVDEHKTVPASEEASEEFRRRVRNLKFAYQIVGEEFLSENGQPDEIAKFLPLVRRRQDKTYKLENNLAPDGSLFTFEPPKKNKICGCTDAQLKTIANLADITVEAVKKYHNQPVSLTSTLQCVCPNPTLANVHQNKHVVGSWDCRACLNLGTEISDTSSADAALQTPKALKWCPKFISLLRNLELPAYIKALKDNKSCYAGLMHSEMSFVERFYDDKGADISDLMQFADHPEIFEKKSFVIITKKCDTCGNTIVTEKEYVQPEPIQIEGEGTVLQRL